MRRKSLLFAVLALSAATTIAAAQAPPPGQDRWSTTVPSIGSGAWTGPRVAGGQPDVQGFWSNTIANHGNFTDPQAGEPGKPSEAASLPRNQRAPSRVSDPADGQVPYLPAARALQEDFAKHFTDPPSERYIEPLARCAPAGVPKSFMWHGWEIRQYPGYVLFLFDSGTRIVRLGDKPHLPAEIKLWNADSSGHWEGNTLVVDVSNSNSKALFGRFGDFASENVHIVERYIFDKDAKRFNYVATITDPTVYSRPFTVTIPAKHYTEADEPDDWHYDVTPVNRPGKPVLYEHTERTCVENNGTLGGQRGAPVKGRVISR